MRLSPLLAFTFALSACGAIDMASMPIQGSDHSLTLVREKPYAWSTGWDLAVVVARMPDCQRRHHLKSVGDGNLKIEVFRTEQARWVLRQGKRWYIADTETCQLQQFEQPPEDPGTPVGVFEDRNGQLGFTQDPGLVKRAEPPVESGK